MNIRKIASLLLVVLSYHSMSAQSDSLLTEQAVMQMNYHIISMTRIIQDQSIETLNYELDQLLNNLTVEQITSLPEIKSLRTELLTNVQDMKITAQERMLLQKILNIKRRNQVWQATSNALNSTMVMTKADGGKQAAFYTLLSIARGAAAYMVQQGESDIEELEAMWQLKKVDLNNIKDLRVTAFTNIYDLYRRFNLKESHRLVESDAELFADIISDMNPGRQYRRLIDSRAKFNHVFDYDYYVGMSLLSTKGYSSAKESLYSYIDKDLKYQMFRKNDKAAYVNLARLTYEDLSKAEADSLLKMVVATIPDNGTAMIQCALHYLDMNMPEKGYMHLRRCVDNPNISDLGPIVMLIASLADQIRKYPAIWEDVRESVYSLNNLDINSYLAFVGADSEFDLESLNDLITIKNATSRRLLGFKRCLSDKFDIVFDKKCSVNKDVLSVYRESYGEDYIKVCQNSQDYTSGTYSRKYLMTKFPDFNSEPHLLYNFFTSLSDGEIFVVKNNLAKGKDISHYEGMELFDKKQKRLLKRLINRNKSAGYALSSSPVRDSAIVDRFKLDSLYTKSFWKQWNYIPVYGSFVNLYRIFNRSLKVIDGLSTEQYESNHRIHFVGNNLFYTPSAYWEQEKECIRIFFDGLVSSLLTFVYNPDTERVELFSFLSQGNLIYLYPEDKMSPISPSKDEPDCKSDSTLDEDEGYCKSVETKRWWHRLKFWRKD